MPILARLTGKTEAAARATLGKLKKAAGDDCDHVLNALRAAAENDPADPVAWLMATCRGRSSGKSLGALKGNDGDRCGIAAWIAILPDATDNPDPQAPELRRWVLGSFYVDYIAEQVADAARLPAGWRGDWNALARWLRDDLDSANNILPAIRRVVDRPGYVPPWSIAFFDAAVRATRNGRAL